LNDATAIVVVGILLGLIAATGSSAVSIAGHAVWEFLIVFFGGVLVGTLFGLFMSWLVTRFTDETSAVLILSLVLAYVSFVVAEHSLHVSGVMAVVACAIVFGIFGIARLSREIVEVMHETWAFIAHICNTLLFLFVGLLVDLPSLISDFWLIMFAVFLVQASRASMVYSLVPLAERVFKLPHVTLGERHIMFWGGLKGGLAIAIVLSLPVELPGREQLIHLTLGVVLFTLLVNAPTLRPLIRKLGIDTFSDDENAELKRGLTVATQGVETILGRFRETGLLSKANHHTVKEKASELLQGWTPEIVGDDEFRFQRLNAVREELVELEDLYKSGVLSQYSYLDLFGEIQRKRDHILKAHRLDKQRLDWTEANVLLNIEYAILKYLREKDWAAGFMPYYQNRRMSNHLMRNIAQILMSEAALSSLRGEKGIHDKHREKLIHLYKEHVHRLKRSIEGLRSSFPEFLERYESRLSARIALFAAMREVENVHYDGMITTKVYVWLEHHIKQAIKNIPPITEPIPLLQARDLVEMIPLFSGLPDSALDQLSRRAKPVNYLVGDTIIGTGEHGDALYVISRGRVSVIAKSEGQEKQIAEMGAGEFFGEMALLGDRVRRADVKANTACTLLRLKCNDILSAAETHTVISDRLNEAKVARSLCSITTPGSPR
jgi:CPA1 family monovalent cation:H+ antiporter